MPTNFDLLNVTGFSNPSLSLLNVTGSGIVSASSLFDLINVTGTGTLVAGKKFDLLGVSGTGFIAIILDDFPDMGDVLPGELVTLTAVVENYEPDGFTWTQRSGPTVELIQSFNTCTFRTPITMAGSVVILGVQATVAGNISEEVTAVISVQGASMEARAINGISTWKASEGSIR